MAIPVDQKQRVLNLLASGLTTDQVVKSTGVSRTSITRIRREHKPGLVTTPQLTERGISETQQYAEALDESGLIETIVQSLTAAYRDVTDAKAEVAGCLNAVDRVKSHLAIALARVKVAEIIAAIPMPAVEKLIGKGAIDSEGSEELRNLIQMSAISDGKVETT